MKNKIQYDPSKIYSPISGTTRTLKSLEDGVYSEKMLGDGIVLVIPKGTKKIDVHAPIEGVITLTEAHGYAYEITTEQGLRVLVHIGIDSVNLNGSEFHRHVKLGHTVSVGDRLATVDVEKIGSRIPTSDVILVVKMGSKLTTIAKGAVEVGQPILSVEIDAKKPIKKFIEEEVKITKKVIKK